MMLLLLKSFLLIHQSLTQTWLQYDTELTLSNFSLIIPDPTLSWTITSPFPPNRTSNCSGNDILGGFDLLNSNQTLNTLYTNLPPHLSIKLDFQLYLIDNWTGQSVYVSLDGSTLFFSAYDNTLFSNICGDPSLNDQIADISVNQTHNMSAFAFQISTSLPDPPVSIISWGFRQFIVSILIDCFPLCNICTNHICTDLVPFAKQVSGTTNVTCKDGFYFNSNFSFSQCLPCDPICRTCSGNSSYTCLSCYDDDQLYTVNVTLKKCNFEINNGWTQAIDFLPNFTTISSSWKFDSAILLLPNIDTFCFPPINVAGGYGVLGPASSFARNYSTSAAHYYSAIRFQLFTYGLVDANLTVTADSNLYTRSLKYPDDGADYLAGKSCNGRQLSHYHIAFNFSHTAQQVTVNISLPPNNVISTYYWGVNNFVLMVNLCHYTCGNCTGPSELNCSSCYPNSTFNSTTNTCVCLTNLTQSPYPIIWYWVHNPATACVVPLPHCLNYVGTTSYGCSLCESQGFYLMNQACYACNSSCITCANLSYCTSCHNGYYLNNGVCLCNPGTYMDGNGICQLCNANCLTCQGNAFYCISCQSSMLLQISICVASCWDGFFTNGSLLGICKQCNSSCFTCDVNQNNCTSCPLDTYLLNNNCNNICPDGFWANSLSKTCDKCDISCKTCFGRFSSHCYNCSNGFYNESNTCVEFCTNGYFFINDTCQNCDFPCSTCDSTSNNCTSCVLGYFLRQNTSICLRECLQNQFFDQILLKCQNYYLTTANLFRNFSENDAFSIIFSNYSQSFLDLLVPSKAFSIQINGVSNNNYNFSLQKTQNFIKISIFYITKIDKTNKNLSIPFNLTYLNSVSFDTLFLTHNLSIPLIIPITLITPAIQKTSDVTQFTLSFTSQFPELLSQISNITHFSITYFSSNNYYIILNKTSNPLIYSLQIFYKFPLVGPKHLLEVSFSWGFDPLFDIIPRRLTTKTVHIQLYNYYILDQNDQNFLSTSEKITDESFNAATASVSIYSMLHSSSSLLFSGLLLLKSISWLKYLDINYPPNALAIFEAQIQIYFFNFPGLQFTHVDANNCDVKFGYYNLDSYVLNNLSKLFIPKMIIFLMGILVFCLATRCPPKNKFFKWWIFKLKDIFCWNVVIGNFLSFMNDFYFYSFLNIAFSSDSSNTGLLNMTLSYLNVFLGFLFLLFLYYKISLITLEFKISEISPKNIDDNSNNNNNSNNVFLNNKNVNISNSTFMASTAKKAPISHRNNNNNSSILENSKENNEGSILEEVENSARNLNISNDNINNISNILQSLKRKFSGLKRPESIKTSKILPFDDKIIKNFGFSDNKKIKKEENNKILPNDEKLYKITFADEKQTSKKICLDPESSRRSQNIEEVPLSSKLKTANSSSIRPSQLGLIPNIEASKNEKKNSILEKYKILHFDYKQKNKWTYLYFYLDLMRFLIISAILVFDRYHPMRQTIFISLISLINLIMLLIIRPFKSKYLLVMNALNQTCVIFCEISAGIIAFYDMVNDDDQEKRFQIGKIIVFGNLVLIYLITLVMGFYFLFTVYLSVKSLVKYCRKRKRNTIVPFEDVQHNVNN